MNLKYFASTLDKLLFVMRKENLNSQIRTSYAT